MKMFPLHLYQKHF